MTGALDGVGVLVTRPAHQAGGFAYRVEQAGGRALRLPVVAIESLLDSDAVRHALEAARQASLLVFTSRNAAEIVAPWLQGRRAPGPGTLVAAVGEATARELRRHGLPVHIVPRVPASSESLLESLRGRLPPGRPALLLRGEGGRDLLARALAQAGLPVTDVACYRRVAGPARAAELRAWLGAGAIDVVTVTSVEILNRLLALAGDEGAGALRALDVVSGGCRIASACRQAGWHAPVVATDPTDDAMLAALLGWRAGARGDCGTLLDDRSSPARKSPSQDEER